MNNTNTASRKQIFMDWLTSQDRDFNELNHDSAKKDGLKFDNHCSNADEKEFISKDVLKSAFKTIMKSSK
jgi:hypothetical protein